MFNDGQAICLGSSVSTGSFLVEDGIAISSKSFRDDYIFFLDDVGVKVSNEFDTRKTLINSEFVYVQADYTHKVEICNKPEAQVKVTHINTPISFLTASVLVVGDSSDDRCILNYLSLNDKYVSGGKVEVNYVSSSFEVADSGICIVRKEIFKESILSTNFIEKKVVVSNASEENKINFNQAITSVVDGRPSEVVVPVNTIVKVYVEDNKPPTPTVPNNSSLKSFTIVVQKYCYIEYLLRFEGLDVVSIIGLPQGIQFYDGYLKGTALVSGDFNVFIYLNDGTAVQGFIKVPEVPRQL